jgi:hypothetical protein
MAIGKISGPMLQTDLSRQGVDLSVDTNLVYFDVTNRRLGVNTVIPTQSLDVMGNVHLANLSILGNTITSDTGKINLGTPSNVVLSGGTSYDVIYTDGAGNLAFGNINVIAGLDVLTGNNVTLGSNTSGSFSNAVTLSSTTTVTDAISIINENVGNVTANITTLFSLVYANANVSAYLPGYFSTYSGNINAGSVISTFYGNIHADTITGNTGNVVTIGGTGALRFPVGTTAQRPPGQNGLVRFNTELPSIEYFDGNAWIPITNTVTDQQIVPDGVSAIYSLEQEATTIGVIVSINGIIQRPTVAYTVNTNQITFTEIPEATDIIDIRFLGAAVSVNSVLSDDLVISGNLTVNGNIVNGLNNFYTYGNAQVAAYLVANPQGSIYSNANVQSYIGANIGSLWVNAATQNSSINSINANIGSFYTYSNTTYSTVANAGTQQASIDSINANIGSFYTYANTILYSNTNVAAYLTTSTITTTGNITAANLTTAGNLTANYVKGNGGLLTNLPVQAGTYGNTNVAAYLTTGNISTSNLSVTGNLTVSGNSTLTGNVTAPTANISVNNTQLATTAFVRSMLPTGIIVMWSGSSASIPYGWYLCNGANGTPNLQDRFVVGAGSTYSVGATGGTADAIVVSHTHSITDPGHSHSVSLYDLNDFNQGPADLKGAEAHGDDTSGAFTVGTDSKTTGISIASTGSSGTGQNLPPYYALCYIMKS